MSVVEVNKIAPPVIVALRIQIRNISSFYRGLVKCASIQHCSVARSKASAVNDLFVTCHVTGADPRIIIKSGLKIPQRATGERKRCEKLVGKSKGMSPGKPFIF